MSVAALLKLRCALERFIRARKRELQEQLLDKIADSIAVELDLNPFKPRWDETTPLRDFIFGVLFLSIFRGTIWLLRALAWVIKPTFTIEPDDQVPGA